MPTSFRTRLSSSHHAGLVVAGIVILAGIIASCASSSPTNTPGPTQLPPAPTARASATAVMATPTDIPATPTPTTTRARVTAETVSELCDPGDVQAIIEAFIAAYNAGDPERLASLFPTEAYPYAPSPPSPGMNQRQFRGYGVGDFLTGELPALMEHFNARQLAGERFTLQDLVVGGIYRDPRWETPEVADFGIQLIRAASDVTPYTIVGKGAVNCVQGYILFVFAGETPNGVVVDDSMLTGEPFSTPTPPDTSLWGRLRRPLDLPWVGRGDVCPASPTSVVHSAFGAAAGSGPVYAVIAPRAADGAVELQEKQSDGRYPVKVLWIADPVYEGSVLVRGRRIDGPGIVRFSSTSPADELQLSDPSGSAMDAPGWRIWTGGLRLEGPGCYALQIDGEDFSQTIVLDVIASAS